MTGDQIHYEELAQDALRGVVREVLLRAERDGLPGDHHFYIAFDTQADGVKISKRLKEQYPEEMTVVMQHQFWELKVTDTFFEIQLSFNNIPERLVVPFTAIKVFFDPSVPYGLQFGNAAEISNDETQHVLALPDLIGENEDMAGVLPPSHAVERFDGDASNDVKDTNDKRSAVIVELDTFRKK